VIYADKVEALGNTGQSWAVQKGNKALLEKADAALKELIADCTYTKLRKQFLPVPTSPDEPAACQ
jgi:arginine/ornithine transport system substrate-binding protein